MLKRTLEGIKCPRKILRYFCRPLEKHGFFDHWTDERWIKTRYWLRFGVMPDLLSPKTFNEKLQWLKLHYRKPELTAMVDKYAVKQIVAAKLGEEYVIPTLGVYDCFDDIDFRQLPDQFVLKCTHDSGSLVICKDKKHFDIAGAKETLTTALRTSHYLRQGREWPYKNVQPRIIAEQYLAEDIRDYKIFCFNGIPKITLVCSDRFSPDGLTEDFFDEEWNHLDISRPDHGHALHEIQQPSQFSLMKELAALLAGDLPFCRVDFYEVNQKVSFGEITFYPASGFMGFVPESWDKILGDWISLPQSQDSLPE